MQSIVSWRVDGRTISFQMKALYQFIEIGEDDCSSIHRPGSIFVDETHATLKRDERSSSESWIRWQIMLV